MMQMSRSARTATALVGAAVVALPLTASAQVPFPPSWVELTPGASPSARTDARMVYDSALDRTVMFGGSTRRERFGTETWTWDGSTWAQLHPETSPSLRLREAMAYDPVRDEIILYGGWYREEMIDTWSFKDGEWSELSPRHNPHSLQSHMMAWDPNRQQVILFGGVYQYDNFPDETWAWDGTDWTELHPEHSPSARTVGALAYDPTRDGLVLFGGYDSDGKLLRDTWVWDGEDWTQESPRRSPPARGNAAVATFGRHLAIFGGSTNGPVAVPNDTWRLRRDTWRRMSLDPAPVARFEAVASWDSVRRELILFGGSTAEDRQLADTWALRP